MGGGEKRQPGDRLRVHDQNGNGNGEEIGCARQQRRMINGRGLLSNSVKIHDARPVRLSAVRLLRLAEQMAEVPRFAWGPLTVRGTLSRPFHSAFGLGTIPPRLHRLRTETALTGHALFGRSRFSAVWQYGKQTVIVVGALVLPTVARCLPSRAESWSLETQVGERVAEGEEEESIWGPSAAGGEGGD
jgi:hypothetical protein